MNATAIEWTEKTWNPVIGCDKISSGCKNCYAAAMAKRLQAMGQKDYVNGFQLNILPERLNQPILEKKPSMFFVNSMSDLFHEDIPDEYIEQVISVMIQTPRHIYQVLTKRAKNMEKFFKTHTVPENMWIGVTVEDQPSKYRIDHLKNIQATTRFLSIEPLLEDLGELDFSDIHWVIVGGESGVQARPMQESWAINIKNQCERDTVPFFFKQWGTWGVDLVRRSKKNNGKTLQGKVWKQYPSNVIRNEKLV